MMVELHFGLLVIATLFVSLLAGSLLNMVIHRLPVMIGRAEESGNSLGDVERFDLWVPRSRCPNCREQIPVAYLVPVLSWMALRGRCRSCAWSIPVRYPLVELGAAVLAFASLVQFGFALASVPVVLCLWLLLALAITDLESGLLPDGLTYPLLWTGLLSSVLISGSSPYVSPQSAILGAVFGYLAFRLLYEAFRILLRRESMGFGDFKLASGIGAWVGIDLLLPTIIMASFMGLCVGLVLVAVRRYSRTEGMPFAPYLSLAAATAILFGDGLSNVSSSFQAIMASTLLGG